MLKVLLKHPNLCDHLFPIISFGLVVGMLGSGKGIIQVPGMVKGKGQPSVLWWMEMQVGNNVINSLLQTAAAPRAPNCWIRPVQWNLKLGFSDKIVRRVQSIYNLPHLLNFEPRSSE